MASRSSAGTPARDSSMTRRLYGQALHKLLVNVLIQAKSKKKILTKHLKTLQNLLD